ncbi:hypothetical protein Scep_013586 [Stephania cephalantha]|uniref:25S rRNA (uridine-N(3))-methyltransferase BMT5-like domain-containing protein n=1 Tax=Stephania cephalantha TaxID=152367 RepID=A0AAP0JJ21_9MAGN
MDQLLSSNLNWFFCAYQNADLVITVLDDHRDQSDYWSTVVDPDHDFPNQEQNWGELVRYDGDLKEEPLMIKGDFEELKKFVDVISRPIEEIKQEIWIKHYCSSHKILLVGEGDFSFSACLGRAFGRAVNMVATSLNSQDNILSQINFLKKNYGQAMSNIQSLRSRGCKVIHKVNATEMAGHKKLNVVKYDRIVYNFPHAGFSSKESVTDEIRKHRNSVSLFMANAMKMIEEKGEIHISHKCNKFFRAVGFAKIGKEEWTCGDGRGEV